MSDRPSNNSFGSVGAPNPKKRSHNDSKSSINYGDDSFSGKPSTKKPATMTLPSVGSNRTSTTSTASVSTSRTGSVRELDNNSLGLPILLG